MYIVTIVYSTTKLSNIFRSSYFIWQNICIAHLTTYTSCTFSFFSDSPALVASRWCIVLVSNVPIFNHKTHSQSHRKREQNKDITAIWAVLSFNYLIAGEILWRTLRPSAFRGCTHPLVSTACPSAIIEMFTQLYSHIFFPKTNCSGVDAGILYMSAPPKMYLCMSFTYDWL